MVIPGPWQIPDLQSDHHLAHDEQCGRFCRNIRRYLPLNEQLYHLDRIDSGLTNLTITALLANGATVYAGSNGGGVFRSTDNGSHWTAFNSGLPSPYVHAFATNGAIVLQGAITAFFLHDKRRRMAPF